jgi:hypothetical protein
MTDPNRQIEKLPTLTWPEAVKPSRTFRTTGKLAGLPSEGRSAFRGRGRGLG